MDGKYFQAAKIAACFFCIEEAWEPIFHTIS
jgi:hypothetical protein